MDNNTPKTKNIIGHTFGRWTVISFAGVSKHRKSYWNCLCACGTERAVSAAHLIRGKSTNCGCVRKEKLRDMHLIHGMSKNAEYAAWSALIRRCTDPLNPGYSNYGERGINVCERWLHSFEAFYEDMGPRPSSKHSIDRINNDGDYSPENCRWITHKEQCNNMRRNTCYTLDGRTQTLAQWAEEIGISSSALTRRIRSWSLENALTKPPMKYKARTI